MKKTVEDLANDIGTQPEDRWIDGYLINDDHTRYCAVGWALHVNGVPDETIARLESGVGKLQQFYNVSRAKVQRIFGANDVRRDSYDWETYRWIEVVPFEELKQKIRRVVLEDNED